MLLNMLEALASALYYQPGDFLSVPYRIILRLSVWWNIGCWMEWLLIVSSMQRQCFGSLILWLFHHFFLLNEAVENPEHFHFPRNILHIMAWIRLNENSERCNFIVCRYLLANIWKRHLTLFQSLKLSNFNYDNVLNYTLILPWLY